MQRNYDCTGSVLYAWSGVGESRVHSSDPATFAPVLNSGVDVKNAGTAQGLAPTTFPLANRSYRM